MRQTKALLDSLENSVPAELMQAEKRLGDGVELAEMCGVWLELKETAERLETLRKSVNSAVANLGTVRIPEAMDQAGVDKIQVPELKRSFYPLTKWNARMKDTQAAMAWLRENDGDDLIRETVHARSLATWLKERLLEQGLEAPEEVFQFRSYKTTGSSRYTPR